MLNDEVLPNAPAFQEGSDVAATVIYHERLEQLILGETDGSKSGLSPAFFQHCSQQAGILFQN